MVGSGPVQLRNRVSRMKYILLAAGVYFGLVSSASAYIGPSMAAGTIGVVVGVVGSVFLALFALLYYPIKRMLKNIKSARSARSGGAGNKEPQ